MDYLRTLDKEEISVFDVCQAYQQLEADYNHGGWLRERPSNQRRRESIGCQLHRLQYDGRGRHVDIEAEPAEWDEPGDDDVRLIYMSKVMQWGLPADEGLLAAINRFFVRTWLEANHPKYLLPETACTTTP